MLEEIMHLHICREDHVATTNQNSDFLCSCFCSLTMRAHNIQRLLSYIVHFPQNYRPSVTCVILQLFTTAIEPVMPLKYLGPGHCLFTIHCLKLPQCFHRRFFRPLAHCLMQSCFLCVKPVMLCLLLPVALGVVFVFTCCSFTIFIFSVTFLSYHIYYYCFRFFMTAQKLVVKQICIGGQVVVDILLILLMYMRTHIVETSASSLLWNGE